MGLILVWVVLVCLYIGGAAVDIFDTSHLQDLNSYDYPMEDHGRIDTSDDDTELFAQVRRYNPDFEEPTRAPQRSYLPYREPSIEQEPYSFRQSSSGYQQQYYEPISPGNGYHDSRDTQKQAREYPEYHGGMMMYPSQGYQQQQVKVKKVPVIKKVYVPVPVMPKEKKKKIISIDKGFHVPGGTQVFGKFKKLKDCMKLCAAIPTCFAADYNPWLYTCYIHSNITACSHLRAHKKFIHFKKVPCEIPEAPQGLITLGAQLFNGLEQKGIKSLQDCLKKCATAGGGIAPSITALVEEAYPQLCFGIDYDFGTHKCYFFTNKKLCPATPDDPVVTPISLVANPAVVNILLCPAAV